MCFLPLCNRGSTLSVFIYLQPISVLCVIFSPSSNVGGASWPPQDLQATSHLSEASAEFWHWLWEAHTCFTLQANHRNHPGGPLPLIRSVSWHRVLQTIRSWSLESPWGKGLMPWLVRQPSWLLVIPRGSSGWCAKWLTGRVQDKASSRPPQPCGKGICFLGKEVIYLWENTVSTKFA